MPADVGGLWRDHRRSVGVRRAACASKTGLTPRQRAEVDRLILQQRRMREVVEDILSLAEELKGTTIEAVLAKSDFALGLEAVFGGRILDQRPPPSQRAREASRAQRLNLP